jgi:hypothetical protein
MKIPLLHITDLYHPPQDPDDHLDLAAIVALAEYELRGVVLDATERFLLAAPQGENIARDPGYVPVAQLCYLTGRAVPVGVGPIHPLQSSDDTASDRPQREQSGIRLILDVLENSKEPVTISVVGSVRTLMAAFNRNPALLRAKTSVVILNAGSTASVVAQEWNVDLDPAAYNGLWQSNLPIHWYPCTTERGSNDADHPHGTYWAAAQRALFNDLPAPLRSWVCYAYGCDQRGEVIKAMSDLETDTESWRKVLDDRRNLWSTASLVMAAGRVLARAAQGWRFISAVEAGGLETWPWSLEPIDAAPNQTNGIDWKPTKSASPWKIFTRDEGNYGAAMCEAFNALLKSMPC